MTRENTANIPDLRSGERPVVRRPLNHPPASSRLTRVLGERYRLEALLGIGAMGEVYRAYDLKARQPCAIKLVLPSAIGRLQAHKRFLTEAEAISRLFHPNIVEVRSFDEDEDGTKFLVMELLEGEDLQSLLSRSGRLPLERALGILRAVGSALQYAHDLGVVHRDIKPSNIFLSRTVRRNGNATEQVKVLDFGLAKLQGQSGQLVTTAAEGGDQAKLSHGLVLGTPTYLPPESMRPGARRLDPRVDQWSLAVVAYQLLSGMLPFEHPNPRQLALRIRYEDPLPLRLLSPELPPHVYLAIEVALSKRREHRFAQIKDFIRMLDNLPVSTAQASGVAAAAAAAVHSGPEQTPLPLPMPLLDESLSVPDFVTPENEVCSLAAVAAGQDVPLRQRTVQYTASQLHQLLIEGKVVDAAPAPVEVDEMPTVRYRTGVPLPSSVTPPEPPAAVSPVLTRSMPPPPPRSEPEEIRLPTLIAELPPDVSQKLRARASGFPERPLKMPATMTPVQGVVVAPVSPVVQAPLAVGWGWRVVGLGSFLAGAAVVAALLSGWHLAHDPVKPAAAARAASAPSVPSVSSVSIPAPAPAPRAVDPQDVAPAAAPDRELEPEEAPAEIVPDAGGSPGAGPGAGPGPAASAMPPLPSAAPPARPRDVGPPVAIAPISPELTAAVPLAFEHDEEPSALRPYRALSER